MSLIGVDDRTPSAFFWQFLPVYVLACTIQEWRKHWRARKARGPAHDWTAPSYDDFPDILGDNRRMKR